MEKAICCALSQKKKGPILFIDKDLYEFENIKTAKDLISEVKKNLPSGGALYIDEVQEIADWEKAITSLHKHEIYDIYLTGSNAQLLSSELATRLSGRYVEISIYPLSFLEFTEYYQINKTEIKSAFQQYLKYGGLPGLKELEFKENLIYPFLQGIYSTVILKDVIQKNQIRNARTLENICRFVFDNVGQIFSAQKITKFMKNQGYSIGVETVMEYLKYLEQAQVIHRVPRFDIKGKRLLEIYEKYFINDLGIRHATIGFRENALGQILENLVFLELKIRGYQVYIGKLGELEIDFIATKENEKIYIQVCYLLASKETILREFKPLEKIHDNYEKIVLSLDETWGQDYNGIKRFNLIEWLVDDQRRILV